MKKILFSLIIAAVAANAFAMHRCTKKVIMCNNVPRRTDRRQVVELYNGNNRNNNVRVVNFECNNRNNRRGNRNTRVVNFEAQRERDQRTFGLIEARNKKKQEEKERLKSNIIRNKLLEKMPSFLLEDDYLNKKVRDQIEHKIRENMDPTISENTDQANRLLHIVALNIQEEIEEKDFVNYVTTEAIDSITNNSNITYTKQDNTKTYTITGLKDENRILEIEITIEHAATKTQYKTVIKYYACKSIKKARETRHGRSATLIYKINPDTILAKIKEIQFEQGKRESFQKKLQKADTYKNVIIYTE